MSASYNEQFEQHIAEFERQWRMSPPADLGKQLVALRGEDARLVELLSVDLEYRWRSKRGSLQDGLGGQPRIEDYVSFAKSCGYELPISAEWISEEYRVRKIWGDQPSIEHFLGRFSAHAIELEKLLSQVAAELSRERIRTATAELEYDERAPLPYQDFKILKLIGSGVSARVYRAKQLSLNRMVALKALHKSLQLDDWAIDAFLREGQIIAGLDHPGIARMFGMGRFPGGGYFQIQELVEGTNLREWLGGTATIDHSVLIHIVKSITDAIAFAHERSVVHCDIKPENILMSNERIVVADFGMATLISDDTDSPQHESVGGTPNYMAPELERVPTTLAADVYSIGTIWKELNSFVEQPEPNEWTALRERCRSSDPAQRPSASELAQRLSG